MAKSGTRDRILQAAFRHFHEFGYAGTSVLDIVRLAKVPKGSFYNHFKSKELLALEVLNTYLEMAQGIFTCGVRTEDVPPATDKSATSLLREQFETTALFFGGLKFATGCMMGNFAAEAPGTTKPIQSLTRKGYEVWAGNIAASIRQAQVEDGIAPGMDPERLARYLLDAWQGAILRMKLTRSRAPLDDFFHFTFDGLLSAGVVKKPAARVKKKAHRAI